LTRDKLRNAINNACDIMRREGLTTMNYTEQLSWLLFLWLRQAVETLTKKVEKLVAEQKKPVLSTTHAHIVRVQGVKGGEPIIRGKGILTLAEVHDALGCLPRS
jgi:hypothetical protein